MQLCRMQPCRVWSAAVRGAGYSPAGHSTAQGCWKTAVRVDDTALLSCRCAKGRRLAGQRWAFHRSVSHYTQAAVSTLLPFKSTVSPERPSGTK